MGSKKTVQAPAVAAPSALGTAQENLAAQQATNPQAAQLGFNIATNPNSGVGAYTQYLSDVRNSVFGQESDVSNQMLSNILGNLISPTGITAEQQQAVNSTRNLAQNELVNSMRNRANLSGNLFGGRSGQAEQRAVGELQAGFATEDIDRENVARQQAISNSLAALQQLYPELGLSQASYSSPVAGADTAMSSATSYANNINSLAAQQQMANQQQQSALYQALFSALGTAAGGWLGKQKELSPTEL